MENTKSYQAINFTDFCKYATLEEIERGLEFYNEKFTPEKVLKYFDNWSIVYDDSFYKKGVILTNKHRNGLWQTTMTINDNFEYMFAESTNCWQYLPKSIHEFISDVLRYEDFDLVLSQEGYNKLYGK